MSDREKTRLLITGGGGMLAYDLTRAFGDYELSAPTRQELDVTQLADVMHAAACFQPHVVIHTAAMTDADLCEREPSAAWLTNWIGTENVCRALLGSDTQMVYISSCGVFDGGCEKPYTELDKPNPLTVHHHSKFAAERTVIDLAPRHLIIRPGWLFGGLPQHRKNFVFRRLEEARGKRFIYSDAEQRGSPTWTAEVARKVRQLVETKAVGLFHVANRGVATRLDYVREIFKAFGVGIEVRPAPPGFFQRPAPVARSEAIENFHLCLLGLDDLLPWRDAVHAYAALARKQGWWPAQKAQEGA